MVENLKVITRNASARIAEYAFRYCVENNRERVTAVHKASIMVYNRFAKLHIVQRLLVLICRWLHRSRFQKLGDGLFLECCREVAKKYPQIKYDEEPLDNICLKLVQDPKVVDLMVRPFFHHRICLYLPCFRVSQTALWSIGDAQLVW